MSALMAERRDLARGGAPGVVVRGAGSAARARSRSAAARRACADRASTPPDEARSSRGCEAFAPARRRRCRRSRRACDALVDEPFAAPATEEVGERREPRTAGMPLAGPTLDDVMSRVWEGLATGLPAACPVCHGEVEPALGGPLTGRCRSCGTAID